MLMGKKSDCVSIIGIFGCGTAQNTKKKTGLVGGAREGRTYFLIVKGPGP